MEEMKDYGVMSYASQADQLPVLGCKAAHDEQGAPFNCRLTFFTIRLGMLFHYLTYRAVVIPNSGLLGRLLAHFQGDGLRLQACDVSPIGAIIENNPADRHGWIPWILQFLQFAHDRPGRRLLPNALVLTLSADRELAEIIDLHTVATFFEVNPVKRIVIDVLNTYVVGTIKNYFLIFSEGATGTARVRLFNLSNQLQHTADAVERAAPIVPHDSHIWVPIARYLLASRQVLDGTNGGEQARQVIARLNPIAPFAHACLEVSLNIRAPSLVGVFRSPVDWNLQCEACACTGCNNVIFARDLIDRSADDLARGAVQKYALVNPFDGFRTVFCEFCSQRCGVPWAGGNRPCVPHQ